MPDMQEMNQAIIREFRENDGVLSGPLAGAPILLLTTTGRRSGRDHTTPLGYIESESGVALAAANGGADTDPDWFRNLQARPTATVELPGRTAKSEAVVLDGSARQAMLAELVAALPGMDQHVSSTEREIPVIVLTPAT